MKSKYLYIAFFLLSASIIIFKKTAYKSRQELRVLERNSSISNSSEWINTKQSMEKLLDELRQNPGNNKSKMELVFAYIQESRVTGNHSYYDAVAMDLINDLLKADPKDYRALCAKGTIQLSQHHFAEALETGTAAVKINSHSVFAYGILTDANVELGNYEQAVINADKMVAVRPDINSYSRVAYLRELHGNANGAMEAMKMAVNAGVPGTEQTEWCRYQLGKLYETYGKTDLAEIEYNTCLFHRPNYAFAYSGLARIELSKKNYEASVRNLQLAKVCMDDFSFSQELGEIYRLTGDNNKANEEFNRAIQMLSNTNANSKSSHGHYSDKELAQLYLLTYKYDLALQHALTEYNRRPLNAGVNQTLAWVYYRRGDITEANNKINVALKAGSIDPTLLLQAGLIKTKSGELKEGRKLLSEGLKNNCTDLFTKLEAQSFISNLITEK